MEWVVLGGVYKTHFFCFNNNFYFKTWILYLQSQYPVVTAVYASGLLITFFLKLLVTGKKTLIFSGLHLWMNGIHVITVIKLKVHTERMFLFSFVMNMGGIKKKKGCPLHSKKYILKMVPMPDWLVMTLFHSKAWYVNNSSSVSERDSDRLTQSLLGCFCQLHITADESGLRESQALWKS